MGAVLKMGPGFNEASETSPAKASVQLLLDLTMRDRRERNNLLDDHRAKNALQIHENYRKGHPNIALEINRGDQPVQEDTVRIYFGTGRDLEKPCHVLIPGLAIDKLGKGIQHDPKLTVKALTVDGMGGELHWTKNTVPVPCLWYFIENIFIRTPDQINLDSLKGSTGQRNTPGWSTWELEPELLTVQKEALSRWFSAFYTPKKAACPTRRPITERYLTQLQAAPLNNAQKTARGELFFGKQNYHDLLTRIARP